MRGHLAGTAAWVAATAAAGALVAGAVRVAVDSVASPASLAPPARHPGQRLPVDVEDPPHESAHADHGPATTERLRDVSGERAGPGASPALGASGSSAAAVASAGGPTSATTAPDPGSPSTTASTDPSDSTTTTTTDPGASTTSTAPTTTASTTTTTAQPTYSYQMTGGTVGVQCSGNAVSLKYATPNSGFTTSVMNSGPDVVDVRFQSSDWRSEIEVTCSGGQPQPQIHDESA
jgi:hypothetical protein